MPSPLTGGSDTLLAAGAARGSVRDRSLDEFLDGEDGKAAERPPGDPEAGDARTGDGVEPGAGGAPDGSEPAGDDPAVEPAIRPAGPDPAPAASTFAFSPEGAPCGACGARVERRWRDEAGLVCGDCKNWSASSHG